MSNKTLCVMLIVVAIVAFGASGALAAWQQTEVAEAVATIVEGPVADGFRVLSSDCTSVRPGEQGSCMVYIENLSNVSMSVDVITVTSGRDDVMIDYVSEPGSVAAFETGYVFFNFTPGRLAPLGLVTFTVEVTCSGG